MENEVVILSETNGKDEKNAVEVLVSEERVEARAVLASDGRNELEEEVFAEAEEYMLEQGMESDVKDDPVVGQERKLEATDDLLAGVDDIPSVGDKLEKFEEAIGVSGKVGEAEQKIAPAAEVVGDLTEMNNDNGVAIVKGIDDGGTDVQLIPDEVNRLSHDGFLGGGEDEGKYILDIRVDAETEAPNGVVGGGEDGGKEISENHAVGEIVAQNGLGAGGEDGEREISEIGSSGRAEATDYSVGGEDGEEGTAKVGAGSKIEATNGVCDAGVSSFTTIDDSTSKKDNADNVNVEQVCTDEDPHNNVDNIDSLQETLSNKDVSNIASNSLEACQNTFDVDDKGGVIEQQKDSANHSLELHDVRVPKMCETNNATGHEDHNNNKLNDVASGIDSIDRDDSCTELRDIYIIAEQKDQDIKEVKDFSVDPSIIEKPEMVMGSAAELRAEDDTSYQTPRVVESAAFIDEHVKKEQNEKQIAQVKEEQEEKQRTQLKEEQVEKQSVQMKEEQEEKQSAKVTKELAEKQYAQVIKEQEEKQSAQASREQETQPAHQPASSSEKSPNLAPPPARPAGLGRGAPLLEPGPRVVQQPRLNGSAPQVQNQQIEEPINGDPEESDETREKLQMIRVKFLRLAHRLGQTPHNVVVAQVLYRLGLAEQLRGRNGGRVGAFSFDRASAMAEQLEAAGNEPLDFSCTIMVLGKTGVGKSATINSIFDEMKFNTDAFQTGTKKVQDVVGTVQGIKIRVIDTPGLFSSWADQRQNEKILHSVKHFIKNTPPDIVLYLDRLDMQSRDFSDMPLLRNITDIFGPSIWFNAIVVLTHAASAPPEGPNGTASSYDMFVTQRSHVVQQAIRQAAGDMRLMNPVSLVENHSACRTNRAGQRVLPNGQVWKPHLLLLSFASKILAEANALLKLQDTSPGKPYTTRSRAPPLPFLLSSLLQSRPQLKLPEEQFGDNDSLDDDLDESSDSDDESEFDELPPFRCLTKAQVEKLSKAQKKAYFDELEYREKLFMKKQLKEEKKRRKLMKKMADSVQDLPSEYNESAEEDGAGAGAASVPVPMPDLALPASFDSDNPTHRFRYLDSSNQWLVRPVLETHGWDHDIGYEGINVERSFVVKNKMPLSFSGQITKDKKDSNVQMEVASSIKHGENKATSLGFDMQTVGKDLAYTLRSETRFSNFRRNKATAGVSITQMGDALSAGVKVEDKLIANKRFWLVMTGGAMTGRGDVAYGGSLEAQLRDKDYPLGRSLSTLGLSVMDWHGDLAIGCNIQSQIPVGRNTNLVARANLNNRGAGQVSIRLNSSEQLQIALMGLIPLLRKLHGYSQQLQYGQ